MLINLSLVIYVFSSPSFRLLSYCHKLAKSSRRLTPIMIYCYLFADTRHLFWTPIVKYTQTLINSQAIMAPGFSMSLHFEVFSLGHLLQNQIGIDGSIHLMNGKHFARQRKKGLWRTVPDLKKSIMSRKTVMVKIKPTAASNSYQNTGSNACYGVNTSTHHQNHLLWRSTNG